MEFFRIVIFFIHPLTGLFRGHILCFHFPGIHQGIGSRFQGLVGQMLVKNKAQSIVHIVRCPHGLAHHVGRIPQNLFQAFFVSAHRCESPLG